MIDQPPATRQHWYLLALLMLMVSVVISSKALAEASADAEKAAIKANLEGSMDVEVTHIENTEAPGVYLVEVNHSELAYVFGSGEFLFASDGDMYRVIDGRMKSMADGYRRATFDNLQDKNPLVFAPKGEVKGEIVVFTDAYCPACQRFHKQVPALNDMGIQVNYLAYPLWDKSPPLLRSAWCSDDPQKALTEAKAGKTLEAASADCEAPIMEHRRMGARVKVRGTPAVYTLDGKPLNLAAPGAVARVLSQK